MTTKQKKSNLVWMDLEMTGLDPEKCTILEVAVVITDNHLNVLEVGPAIAIRHPEKTLRSMEPWSKRHHKKSGLTDACRVSRMNLKKAETLVLKFVKKYCPPNTARLCGNSIWQDRRFIMKYMPRLDSYLHFRMIDTTAVKELANRWYPAGYQLPGGKNQNHRAMNDILDSIKELKYYRSKIFIPSRKKKSK